MPSFRKNVAKAKHTAPREHRPVPPRPAQHQVPPRSFETDEDAKAAAIYCDDVRQGDGRCAPTTNSKARHLTGAERAAMDRQAKIAAKEEAVRRHENVFRDELDKADAMYGQTTPRDQVENYSDAHLAGGVTIIDNK